LSRRLQETNPSPIKRSCVFTAMRYNTLDLDLLLLGSVATTLLCGCLSWSLIG
jgi:hypothetical protein